MYIFWFFLPTYKGLSKNGKIETNIVCQIAQNIVYNLTILI